MMNIQPVFKSIYILPLLFAAGLAGCGGGDSNGFPGFPPVETCNYTGPISGELNYNVNHGVSAGCGGARTLNSELIVSFGGLGSEPNIKIYHENFIPGLAANNRTAHIVIHRRSGDPREWQTADGACTINITSNQHNTQTGMVKISGNGSCSSPALPDTNTGAVSNINIGVFTIESIWLRWP